MFTLYIMSGTDILYKYFLRILNRLIKIKQTLLYKCINLYLLNTV